MTVGGEGRVRWVPSRVGEEEVKPCLCAPPPPFQTPPSFRAFSPLPSPQASHSPTWAMAARRASPSSSRGSPSWMPGPACVARPSQERTRQAAAAPQGREMPPPPTLSRRGRQEPAHGGGGGGGGGRGAPGCGDVARRHSGASEGKPRRVLPAEADESCRQGGCCRRCSLRHPRHPRARPGGVG